MTNLEDWELEEAIKKEALELFGCDAVRISSPCDKHFLILGDKRKTEDDEGQWERNGEPWDFEYLAEKCVASGKTWDNLRASMLDYKRLLGLSWDKNLEEICSILSEEPGDEPRPSRITT